MTTLKNSIIELSESIKVLTSSDILGRVESDISPDLLNALVNEINQSIFSLKRSKSFEKEALIKLLIIDLSDRIRTINVNSSNYRGALIRILSDLINIKSAIYSNVDNYANAVHLKINLIEEKFTIIDDIEREKENIESEISKLESKVAQAESEITEWKETYYGLIRNLQTIDERYNKSTSNAEEFYANIRQQWNDEFNSNRIAIGDLIKKWQDGLKYIKQKHDDIEKTVNFADKFNKELTITYQKHIENIKNIDKQLNDMINREKLSKQTLENIEKHDTNYELTLKKMNELLDESNKLSMAGSFESMMNKVGKQMLAWRIMLFISIVSILTTAMIVIYKTQGLNQLTWQAFSIKLFILSPLLYLAWFSGRRYSIASKVREDYGYKYALSLAIEGYRRMAGDTDPDAAKRLLEFAIVNISENPVRLYGKDHSTPFHELFNSVADNCRGAIGKTKLREKTVIDGKEIEAEANFS